MEDFVCKDKDWILQEADGEKLIKEQYELSNSGQYSAWLQDFGLTRGLKGVGETP